MFSFQQLSFKRFLFTGATIAALTCKNHFVMGDRGGSTSHQNVEVVIDSPESYMDARAHGHLTKSDMLDLLAAADASPPTDRSLTGMNGGEPDDEAIGRHLSLLCCICILSAPPPGGLNECICECSGGGGGGPVAPVAPTSPPTLPPTLAPTPDPANCQAIATIFLGQPGATAVLEIDPTGPLAFVAQGVCFAAGQVDTLIAFADANQQPIGAQLTTCSNGQPGYVLATPPTETFFLVVLATGGPDTGFATVVSGCTI